MQAVLVMFRSDGERRSFSVTRSITVVGRREDSDLRIPLGEVSRKHCRIIKEDDVLRLEDLGSSNGTYHNGLRVGKDAVLGAGDSVQVGPVVFVVQIDGSPGDDDLHPIRTEAAMHPIDDGGGASPVMPMPPVGSGEGSGSLDELQALPEAEPAPFGTEELEPLPLDEGLGGGDEHDRHVAAGAPDLAVHDDVGFDIVEEGEPGEGIPLDEVDLNPEPEHPPERR